MCVTRLALMKYTRVHDCPLMKKKMDSHPRTAIATEGDNLAHMP